MHVAIEFKKESMVRLLLKKGADLTIKNKEGLDCIELAKRVSAKSSRGRRILKLLEDWLQTDLSSKRILQKGNSGSSLSPGRKSSLVSQEDSDSMTGSRDHESSSP